MALQVYFRGSHYFRSISVVTPQMMESEKARLFLRGAEQRSDHETEVSVMAGKHFASSLPSAVEFIASKDKTRSKPEKRVTDRPQGMLESWVPTLVTGISWIPCETFYVRTLVELQKFLKRDELLESKNYARN